MEDVKLFTFAFYEGSDRYTVFAIARNEQDARRIANTEARRVGLGEDVLKQISEGTGITNEGECFILQTGAQKI